VSSLCSYGPLAYFDNERVKQLLYALDDHVWGMKITTLEESASFAILDSEKLFSKLKLLVLVLVAMMQTPPTLSHLLWSLLCDLLLQLLMNSTRASPMMRLPCWRGSYVSCTSSAIRGGGHPGATSSAATPPTSSLTVPRGRSLTPPTSMTTPTGMTPAIRATTRSIALETSRIRSFRRSCPEHVLP
jgi:hypothetical protein